MGAEETVVADCAATAEPRSFPVKFCSPAAAAAVELANYKTREVNNQVKAHPTHPKRRSGCPNNLISAA